MLRTIMITSTAVTLSLASGLARADHDRELRYVVGGALLGAALGELVYVSDYGPRHGYRRGYGVAYQPHRYYAPGRDYRRWDNRRHFGKRHGYCHGDRHGYRHGYRHRHSPYHH